ncbi:MAG: tRNA threonylcarbamoyladenosine dehydratase [Prevotella sp.]|nr:tRNA threonylcarbamoyladenosine dehydratase [Prevotella sp.]
MEDSTKERFNRTEELFGKEAMERLYNSKVAIFGVGGVGGYAAEVLARSGIGNIDIFDNDKVDVTNINRQIYALTSTIGQYKVDVAKKRIEDINPDCHVCTHKVFYLPANADETDLSAYDYVIDCIDTVVAKVELAVRCHEQNIPIISSMGAANKLDATAFKVTDISKTKIDPLAKVVRKRLKKADITHLKVVYSEEEPCLLSCKSDGTPPASNAFVPAAAGLIIGGEVVKDLIKATQEHQ